jgi:hypothetical protein
VRRRTGRTRSFIWGLVVISLHRTSLHESLITDF